VKVHGSVFSLSASLDSTMASRGCNKSKPWLLLSNFHQENHNISNTFSHQISSKLDFKKIVEKNMLKGLLVICDHKFHFLVDAIIPSQYFTKRDHHADTVNQIILGLGTARSVAVYMASINTTRDGSSYGCFCLLCALMAGMGRNSQILSLSDERTISSTSF